LVKALENGSQCGKTFINDGICIGQNPEILWRSEGLIEVKPYGEWARAPSTLPIIVNLVGSCFASFKSP
jgi:hypothetical protein